MVLLSTSGEFFVYAVIGLFLGLGLFYKGIKDWLKFKKVADHPTSKVRSMPAGLVELNGIVTPKETMSSPITRTKCVYYKVEHQVYVRSKNSGSWVTTSVKQDWQNFLLEDETGKVEVDPRQAEIDIPSDHVRTLGNTRDIETFLSPGEIVYVLGSAKIRPGVKTASNPDNFIIGRGENDLFYYITDKKEKDVQAALSGSAKWSIAGGIIITTACFAYLIFQFVL